jgi:hypothetical protein
MKTSFFLQMVFTLAARKTLNYDEKKASNKLRDSYKAFMDGFISFPLYIPGTAFYSCIQVCHESSIFIIVLVFSYGMVGRKACFLLSGA